MVKCVFLIFFPSTLDRSPIDGGTCEMKGDAKVRRRDAVYNPDAVCGIVDRPTT